MRILCFIPQHHTPSLSPSPARGMMRFGDRVSDVSLHHDLFPILHIDALLLWFTLNAATMKVEDDGRKVWGCRHIDNTCWFIMEDK